MTTSVGDSSTTRAEGFALHELMVRNKARWSVGEIDATAKLTGPRPSPHALAVRQAANANQTRRAT
jgi:hypothetical protein